MKMTQFRIQNYRSITDSGWVKLDDISVIVGKNEAGKTSLLKALWKLNPFKDEPYVIDREWPRGRRKEKSADKPVSTAQFEFTVEEMELLQKIDQSFGNVTGVEITKRYDGKKTYNFLPALAYTKIWAERETYNLISLIPKELSETFKKDISDLLKGAAAKVSGPDALNLLKTEMAAIKEKFSSLSPSETLEADKVHFASLATTLDKVIAIFSGESPRTKAIKLVDKILPKFIYMDDHKVFKGTAFLNQVKERKDSGKLSEDDKTIIVIMEMAGLDLDQEVAKGSSTDREQRMLDMNDASLTLTNEISKRWKQKEYEVSFQADGHHFITFVRDQGTNTLVPLDERSKGFQWFFCFDMTFMYETNGQFENAIILLDEPGLHLHPEAQIDLLERFKAYSANNQLIYSTHLPFMINCKRLDNIWVAEEHPTDGSKVHQNWDTSDKDARFTLQAALGLSWMQSLFIGRNNLLVEGFTDFNFINTISDIFKKSGKRGLDESFVITYVGGASKVAYLGTLLRGQQVNVAVLLDSDSEGIAAHQQLLHQKILNAKQILLLGKILNKSQCASEDLFPESYYVQQAELAYKTELKGKTITLKTGKQSVVEKMEEFFSAAKIGFNKGRIDNLIIKDIALMTFDSLPEGVAGHFEQVFEALNKLADTWKALELNNKSKDEKMPLPPSNNSQEATATIN